MFSLVRDSFLNFNDWFWLPGLSIILERSEEDEVSPALTGFLTEASSKLLLARKIEPNQRVQSH